MPEARLTSHASAQAALDALPHVGAMRLLSRVIGLGPDSATAEVDITPDSLFLLPERGVAAWAALEYLGQTAALIGLHRQGERADGSSSVASDDGFLLGSRQLDLHVDAYPLGTTLTVHCSAVGDVGDSLASFDGTVHDAAGRLLASGSLSVVRVARPA